MRTFGLVVVAAGVIGVSTAMTGSTSVPATRAGQVTAAARTAEQAKPSDCSGIPLTAIVVGTSGTNAAELVLGSASGEAMSASGGTDCVLGGGGDDVINGGAGSDVCVGGAGLDTFLSCETQVQ